ncbi:HAD family hydrolase [Streptobacillus felis]|uniref:phosphoserine phosphatase n=1 Tax=Streptobacillus felis TaxID=1384509 RepID=A0A7Z0PF66_9FUSO|nr:HAD family hydrolase [Streptobacillus felis]NYV28153.1 haloacid dehalogenase-like hydrolase [Streptobacillus felis]
MWKKNVKDRIDELINKGKNSNNYAIFDCDNTILMNDIQFALIHYVLKFKKYRTTPEVLKSFLYKHFPNEDNVLSKFMEIFERAYNSEYVSDTYLEFLANIEELVEYLFFKYDHFDITMIFFYDMSEEELRALIQKAIDYHNTVEFGHENWIYEDNISSYKTGLSIAKEMEELIKEFCENNIDVYVISGSPRIQVEEALKPLKPYIKEIYGKELEIIDGKITGEIKEGTIETYYEGKVEIIDKFLYNKYNKGPIFVAGDSMGDYHMLTRYEDTEISLLIDRNRTGKFSELLEANDDRYLSQTVDETIGRFIDAEKSITF